MSLLPSPLSLERAAAGPLKILPWSEKRGWISLVPPFGFRPRGSRHRAIYISTLPAAFQTNAFLEWDPINVVFSLQYHLVVVLFDLLITLAYINAVYSPLQEARSVPRQPEIYSSGVSGKGSVMRTSGKSA
ncbi:hypothetical protein R3P38DRAFT_3228786 [Favolaschia claudopus]|uniref:Uncharacterized protein n=1 Tax=Favolaschia claudopus TaxID=2862362 RepID=A0AAV9ZQT4_9AGAR